MGNKQETQPLTFIMTKNFPLLYTSLDLPIGPLGPDLGTQNARGRNKLSMSEFF